ncbi:odorant receptor 131-2-like [Parambassis ranga]|uniref:Odorant receptor 131-2-like n=1 Tax=Parambassis ranga TaxID=210632 RepID=A0A6P7K838_9TELE|nr:odorant receptor 131-2-like [Parambassis ranga]
MNSTPADSNATWNSQEKFVRAVYMNTTVVILGLTINYINAAMIHTFNKHDILKMNPRYILFIHLVLNDLILLTTSICLFIFIFTFNTVYFSICFVFLLPAIITSQNTPLNLAFMAAECYISVCVPLRYENICTVKKTYIVIGIIWSLSSLTILPDLFILLATEPLQFFQSKVYCESTVVFKSSLFVKKRDASHTLFLVVVWITLFYTYFRILFVAKAADSNAKKARNTLLIHGFQLLLCMMVYVQPMLIKVLLDFFPLGSIFFGTFIVFQIFPRFLSPIIYGLRDKTFRKYFINIDMCTHNKTMKMLS